MAASPSAGFACVTFDSSTYPARNTCATGENVIASDSL